MTDPPAVAVDACVAINLYATGRWAEIFDACGLRPVMATQAAQESIWVLDEDGERVAMALEALVDQGRLEIQGPVDGELELLVELAPRLGDGEAACMAIAHGRGMLLATDDRAARREAVGRGLEDQLVSTVGLLRQWSEAARVEGDELRRTLRRVGDGARFVPPADDPDADWWSAHA